MKAEVRINLRPNFQILSWFQSMKTAIGRAEASPNCILVFLANTFLCIDHWESQKRRSYSFYAACFSEMWETFTCVKMNWSNRLLKMLRMRIASSTTTLPSGRIKLQLQKLHSAQFTAVVTIPPDTLLKLHRWIPADFMLLSFKIWAKFKKLKIICGSVVLEPVLRRAIDALQGTYNSGQSFNFDLVRDLQTMYDTETMVKSTIMGLVLGRRLASDLSMSWSGWCIGIL